MSKNCSVEGCENPAHSKGMCKKHYARYYKHGTTELIEEHNGLRTKYPAEYKTWDAMKQRCLCKTNHAYKHYGGRGIKMPERWQGAHGFANFIEDMGPMPSYEKTAGGRHKYTIDRINNNGDYCKENCRWADIRTQSMNKRNNRKIPGVRKSPRCNSWIAEIKTAGVRKSKSFKTEGEAVAQRKQWEKENPLT